MLFCIHDIIIGSCFNNTFKISTICCYQIQNLIYLHNYKFIKYNLQCDASLIKVMILKIWSKPYNVTKNETLASYSL